MTKDSLEIHPRMKPETVETLKELQDEIALYKQERKEKQTYDWFDDAENITYWDYRDHNPLIIKEFEKLLDNTDWDIFAGKLNLSYTDIDHCRKYNDKSPTREVFNYLLENVQNIQLSLKKVLMVLEEMNQHQILTVLQWQEGIDKLKSSKYVPEREENKSKTKTNKFIEYKPGCFTLNITQQPEVLVNAENFSNTTTDTNLSNTTDTTTLESERSIAIKKPKSVVAPGINIMMIFAQDANEDARFITTTLKKLNAEQGKVRVLQVTGEDVPDTVNQALRREPYNSIFKWFHTVDFVVPILSPQFLRQTQNKENDDSGFSSDQRYNRYIYRNMNDQYVSNGCINTRCRPLCPDRFSRMMCKNKLVKSTGLLQLYWKCSTEQEVEKFATILLKEHGARRT